MNNNKNNNAAAAQDVTFAIISDWVSTAQAKDIMNDLIGREVFTKKQVKKSGYLFANGKDKTDGYICRVLAVTGLHPELERGFRQPRGKYSRKPKVEETVEETAEVVEKPCVKKVMLYLVQTDEDPQPTEEYELHMTEWNSKWNQATRGKKIYERAVEVLGKSVDYEGWEVVKG